MCELLSLPMNSAKTLALSLSESVTMSGNESDWMTES